MNTLNNINKYTLKELTDTLNSLNRTKELMGISDNGALINDLITIVLKRIRTLIELSTLLIHNDVFNQDKQEAPQISFTKGSIQDMYKNRKTDTTSTFGPDITFGTELGIDYKPKKNLTIDTLPNTKL